MKRLLAAASLRLLRPERSRWLRELDRSQWRSPDELAELQRRKLSDLLRGAAASVPFYRQAVRASGRDAGALEAADLGALPLIDKGIMKERRQEFLAEGGDPADLQITHTGGSTGAWFEFFVDRRSRQIRRAADLRGRTWTGWRVGEPQAILWGHRDDVADGSSLGSRLRNLVFNRSIMLNAYDMDDSLLEEYWRQIVRLRPRLVVGYASALAFLAEHLKRHGRTVPSPRGLISSAETLTDDQREIIEAQFRVPLLNRYGSREFGVIAQQCGGSSGLHIVTERIYMEVLSPDGTPCEPGERGEMVLTDLDNRAMPFIRYRTGDLGVLAASPCSCGRGLPLLASVEGRTSELIVGKNGKYYSCQSPRLFGAGIPGIAQMQVIQETLDQIVVKVVTDTAWTGDSREELIARMRDLLGDVLVTVDEVAEIPPAPSGKYRFTISRVSPFGSGESR
jgi:phenylacetate-CoA ligase